MTTRRSIAALLLAPFLSTAWTAAVYAQEPTPPTPIGPPPIGGQAPGGQDAGQQKMLELFAEVELKLREIDSLLFDASTGEVPLGAVTESGIGELLDNARERGRDVQAGIDEILELARSQKPQQQSSSSGQQPQQQPQGNSPLDRPRDQNGGQREQTPSAPDAQQPQPEPQQGEEPKGPGPDPETDPGNRAADAPPSAETERARFADSADRWGSLPVHVREIFRVEGADDLPPQYRDWIDGYYRRLQKIERR